MNEQELLDRFFTDTNIMFWAFFKNATFVVDQDAKTITMPEQTYTVSDMQVIIDKIYSDIEQYESQWEEGNVPEEYKSTLRWIKDQLLIMEGWLI